MYHQVLLKYAKPLAACESTLRSISYFLPGRFPHADICSEAVFALSQLLIHCHDAILSKTLLPRTKFNKYMRSLMSLTNVLPFFLVELTKTMQLLFEMLATRFKSDLSLTMVLCLEMVKTLCKSIIFVNSGKRMLLHSFIPERDYNLSQLGPNVQHSTWTLPRVKKLVPSITFLNGNASSYLLEQALSEPISTYSDHVQPSFSISSEMIWILRPLIYVILLQKHGKTSWIPWMTSLTLEVTSLIPYLDLQQYALNAHLTELEKNEVQRRIGLLSLYLLRDPFYSDWSREIVMSIVHGLQGKPLIGMISNVIQDYQPFWEQYTSTLIGG